MKYAEIYNVYEFETVDGHPARAYYANVDVPKRGKILAELIADHENKEAVFKEENPREGVYFDTEPGHKLGAVVYDIEGQIKLRVTVFHPVKERFSL